MRLFLCLAFAVIFALPSESMNGEAISNLPEFAAMKRPQKGFCEEDSNSFPGEEDALLNKPDKVNKFKDKLGAKVKPIFEKMQQHKSIANPANLTETDTSELLKGMFEAFDGDENNMTDYIENAQPGKQVARTKKLVKEKPELVRLLEKPLVDDAIQSMDEEELTELCDKVKDSSMPKTEVNKILQDFPQCIVAARKKMKKNQSQRRADSQGSQAKGQGSQAMGQGSQAKGQGSQAMGQGSQAMGQSQGERQGQDQNAREGQSQRGQQGSGDSKAGMGRGTQQGRESSEQDQAMKQLMYKTLKSTGENVTIADFEMAPREVTMKDVQSLSDEKAFENEENLDILSRIAGQLKPEVKEKISVRLVTALGEPNTWSLERLALLGKFIQSLPDQMLQEYATEDLLNKFLDNNLRLGRKLSAFLVDTLEDKKNSSNFNKRFCIAINQHTAIAIMMLDNFKSDEIKEALMMCKMIKERALAAKESSYMEMTDDANLDEDDYMKDYMENEDDDDDESEEMEDDDGKEHKNKKEKKNMSQIRPLLKRIFPSNVRVNMSELMDISQYLSMAPAYLFKNVDTDELLTAWPELQKKSPLPWHLLKEVYHKIKPRLPNNSSDFTLQTLKRMGHLLLTLPCKDIKSIPSDVLLEFVQTNYFILNDFPCSMNKEVCKTIALQVVRQASEDDKPVVVKLLGTLGQFLSHKDLMGDKAFCNPYLPKHLAKEMVKRKEKKNDTDGDGQRREKGQDKGQENYDVDEFGAKQNGGKAQQMMTALKKASSSGQMPEKDLMNGAISQLKDQLEKELNRTLKGQREKIHKFMRDQREKMRNFTRDLRNETFSERKNQGGDMNEDMKKPREEGKTMTNERPGEKNFTRGDPRNETFSESKNQGGDMKKPREESKTTTDERPGEEKKKPGSNGQSRPGSDAPKRKRRNTLANFPSDGSMRNLKDLKERYGDEMPDFEDMKSKLDIPKFNFSLGGSFDLSDLNFTKAFDELDKGSLSTDFFEEYFHDKISELIESGEMKLNSSLYDTQDESACEGFGLLAMGDEIFDEVPKNGEGLEFLKTFQEGMEISSAMNGPSLNAEKLDKGFNLLKDTYGLGKKKQNVCIDDAVVEDLACFFTSAKRSDLRNLSNHTRKTVLMAEGKSHSCVKMMSTEQVQEHLDELVEVDDDLKSAEKWEPDMIASKGPALLCGLKPEMVHRLSPATAAKYSGLLCGCPHLTNSARRAIFEKIKEYYGTEYSGNTIENMLRPPYTKKINSCFIYTTKAEIEQLSTKAKKVLVSMSPAILNSVGKRLHGLEKDDQNVEEHAEEAFNAKTMVQTLWTLMDDSGVSNEEKLSQFSDFTEVISPDFIRNLTADEFKGALRFISKNQDWREEQKEVLFSKINEVFGDIDEWTPDVIKRLGGFAALRLRNDTDFEKARMDECTMQSVMRYAKDDMNGAPFKHFCKQVNSSNILEKLEQFPNAICCLKKEDAEEIEAQTVISLFETMDTCNDCLKKHRGFLETAGKAVAKHIESEYESEDGISPPASLMSNLLCLPGMMPESFLLNMSDTSLASFKPEAISETKPEVFCKKAQKDFFKRMSASQFSAISDEKLSCLSDTQTLELIDVTHGQDGEEESQEIELKPDLSKNGIGSIETFTELEADVTSELTQAGDGTKTVVCYSNDGTETSMDKTRLEAQIDGDESALFKSINDQPEFDFSSLSNVDVNKIMKDVLTTFKEKDIKQSFLDFAKKLSEKIESENGENNTELMTIFESLHPRAYSLFEKKYWCRALKSMKETHLQAFCSRFQHNDVSGNVFTKANKACPVCIAFWITKAGDPMYYNIFNKEKAASFYSILKRRRKPLSLMILGIGPKGVTPSALNKVDKNHFKQTRQLVSLAHEEILENFPKNSLRFLAKKILNGKGPFDKWPAALQSRYQYLLFYLTRNERKKELPEKEVLEMLMSEEGPLEVLQDKKIRRVIGNEINSYILRRRQKVTTRVFESFQVFCLQLSVGLPKKLLTSSFYDSSFLVTAAKTCRQYYEMPKYSSKNFLRQILKSRKRDGELLDNLIEVIDLIKAKDLKNFEASAMISAWPKLRNKTLSEKQLRFIWKAMKTEQEPAEMNCDKFEELGRLSLVFPRSFYKAIPDETVLECLDRIAKSVEEDAKEGLPRYFKKSLWFKISGVVKRAEMNMSAFLATDFPKELASIVPKYVYDKLDWDLNMAHLREKAFSFAEYNHKGLSMAGLFKKLNFSDIEEQEGVVDNKEVANILLNYGDKDMFENIEEGESKKEFMEKMAQKADSLSPKTLEKIFSDFKKKINLDDKCLEESVCLDESEAQLLAPLFSVARPADFKCLTKETRQAIAEAFGRKEKLCQRMTIPFIKQMLSLATPSLDESGENLEIKFGCLMCGFSEEQVKSLSNEQASQLQSRFTNCPQYTNEIKRTASSKILENFGGLSSYIESNPDIGMGTLLMHTEPTDLAKLNEEGKEMLSSATGRITAMLTEKKKDSKERRERNEIPETEINKDEEDENKFLSALYDVRVSSQSRRRRKRSTEADEEKCDILEEFNSNLCFLTISKVKELSDDSIQLCSDQFQSCDYGEDVMKELASKASNALGDPKTWEDSDYASLGKLLGHMNESVINEMELTDDNLGLLPDVVIPNGDKLMDQYMKTTNKSLADLSGSDISDYSLLLGSYPTEELNKLEALAISEAVITHDLGDSSLTELSTEKVELFTNKLIESNQIDFSSASSDEITNLGALAGALPEQVMSTLSTEQKSGITADGMSLIKAEVLANSFTVDDFSSMTSEQANALSESQRSQLTPEQNSVVVNKATTVSQDDQGAGSHTSASLLTTLLLCVVALWNMRTDL